MQALFPNMSAARRESLRMVSPRSRAVCPVEIAATVAPLNPGGRSGSSVAKAGATELERKEMESAGGTRAEPDVVPCSLPSQ